MLTNSVPIMPMSVNWNFTNLCNFECLHCYSQDIRKTLHELSYEDSTKVLEVLVENKIGMITFGGGESLLRKDIWNICEKCNEKNVFTRIITNGYIINDNICKEIIAHNVGEILISLDGAWAKTHDYLRNKEGSYNRVVEAIQMFNDYKIDYMILTNINKINYLEMEQFFEFLVKNNVKKWRVNEIKELGINTEISAGISLNTSELEVVHKEIMQFAVNWDGTVVFDSIFAELANNNVTRSVSGCHCGKLSFGLRSNGDIMPCVYYDLKLGNILVDDLHNIWTTHPVLNHIRTKKAEGKGVKCKHYISCRGGCFARSVLCTGNINACDPLCWIK